MYEGDPVYRRLTQGYNNTFHCDIKKGTPKPTVTWYFGWVHKFKKVDSQYDSRYSHPTEEEWTITGITMADKGKYMCIVNNEAGEDRLRFEITEVDGEFLAVLFSKGTNEASATNFVGQNGRLRFCKDLVLLISHFPDDNI